MKNYTNKWILQRLTALLLIPYAFWFIYHCLSFTSMKYNELILFFNSSLNSFLFLSMMFIILIHTKIGCENIIEDYIKNNKVKIINKLAINIVIYFSFILIVIAVVRIVAS